MTAEANPWALSFASATGVSRNRQSYGDKSDLLTSSRSMGLKEELVRHQRVHDNVGPGTPYLLTTV